MKIILGDNQFFGINHSDLSKGEKTKSQFQSVSDIVKFLEEASSYVDGIMMNSNEMGVEVINKISLCKSKEIHFSIPYPHKYASLVNESGMLGVLLVVLKLINYKSFISGLKFLFTRNAKHLIPVLIKLELPKNLEKGNYIYLQNIVTDLCLGLGLENYLLKFVHSLKEMGYKPALITLNPILLDEKIAHWKEEDLRDLCVCYNINLSGFNVYPKLNSVQNFTKEKRIYKRMGMSIFSSGAVFNEKVFDFIKSLNLDYIVFGSSNLDRIKSNSIKFGV